MKSAFRRFVSAAQAFALTSALSACMLTGGDTLVVPGGAEDFPNTVTPLGRIAVSDFSAVNDWEQIPVVTPPMPELPSLDSLQIAPPGAKMAVLGKAGVLAKGFSNGIDTLNMELWTVDTTRAIEAYFFGRIYAYAYDSSAASVRRDTVMAQYLGDMSQINLSLSSLMAVRDSIVANPGKFLMPLDFRGAVVALNPTTGLPTGVRQAYRLRNINATGTMDVAEYQTITPREDGGTHRKWVKIYGPEGAYANADAVPEEFELLLRGPAGDTLSWTLVKDADWDRKLWTSEASGVVDLFFRVRNPQAQPQLSRMHSYLRANYRQIPGIGDSLSQLDYQEQRWLRSGGNVTFTFRGLGTPENRLVGGDTAVMTVDTVFALRDSLIKYSAVYKMLLGPVPDRMTEHKLVGYSVAKNWRRGALFSNTSYFFPATPVLVGQPGFTGTMSTTSVYVNGDTTTTLGTIDSSGFNLQVRSVKNNIASTYDIVLNAAGDLVSYTPVLPDATLAPRRSAP
jgi:hypothetical protein